MRRAGFLYSTLMAALFAPQFVLKFNPDSLLNVARSRGALQRCVKSNSPLLHSQPSLAPSPLLSSTPLSSRLLPSAPLRQNWKRTHANENRPSLETKRKEEFIVLYFSLLLKLIPKSIWMTSNFDSARYGKHFPFFARITDALSIL